MRCLPALVLLATLPLARAGEGAAEAAALIARLRPAPTDARIEALVAQLGDRDFARREEATAALRTMGAAVLPALRRAQSSEDLEVRNRAAALLSAIPSDDDVTERIAAAVELGVRRDPAAFDTLLTVARSTDPEPLRRAAARALAHCTGPQHVDTLRAVDPAGNPLLAAARLLALGRLSPGDPEVRALLRAALDGAPPVRLAAAEALLRDGQREGATALLDLLASTDPAVRWRAQALLELATGARIAPEQASEAAAQLRVALEQRDLARIGELPPRRLALLSYEPKGGQVAVDIEDVVSPVVLVLSSYEPARWRVRNLCGAELVGVELLSHEGRSPGVEGVDPGRVTTRPSGVWIGREPEQSERMRLPADILRRFKAQREAQHRDAQRLLGSPAVWGGFYHGNRYRVRDRGALPRDAELHIVSAYEGEATVRIRPTERPVVLVLLAYEGVRWTVAPEAGARLAGVVLGGYHTAQLASLPDGVPVLYCDISYPDDDELPSATAALLEMTGLAATRAASTQEEYSGGRLLVPPR